MLLYAGLFLFEGFPLILTIVGLLCHLCFASLLTTFPIITLLSVGFIGGSSKPHNLHMCTATVI